MSDLILILGPMKSGKSFEVINHFAPLKYTDITYGLYHSARNVRDGGVWSRNGVELEAKKVHSLKEILQDDVQVVGIDEVHMFEEKDAYAIEELLKRGTKVIISGLDTSHNGRMFPIIMRILELGPTEVIYKKAVCEICKDPNAVYTQILKNLKPVLEGLQVVVPDDGTHQYKSVCRTCFVRK